MRKVLLDTNLLIAAFDEQARTSEEKQEEAKQLLSEQSSDPNIALVITPLIRYEVLRGISWQDSERFKEVKNVLNGFHELDIDRKTSELATKLYRCDVHLAGSNSKRNFEKRKFDIFHFAGAKCKGLELASQDKDIAKIENLYQQLENGCK